MFSVKATYRGEIRKFSFDSTYFPTFDQLHNQLHRIFTQRTNFYFSKLLFSPDASQPGRILIALEIHNADDYARCLLPYSGRSWPNALLRFSVFDETPLKRLSPIGGPFEQVSNFQVSHSHDLNAASQLPATSQPISSFYIPPPPIMFSAPRAYSQTPTDFDPVFTGVTSPNSHTFYHEPHLPSPPLRPTRPGDLACCSLGQSKAEIMGLLQTFQTDLDRILNSTFGRVSDQRDVNNFSQVNSSVHSPHIPTIINKPFLHPSTPPPFSSSCSLCTNLLVGDWYTCRDCHAQLCSGCSMLNTFSKGNYCAVSLAPHRLESASSYHGTFPPTSLSPPPWIAPPPWVPRGTEHFLPVSQMTSTSTNNISYPFPPRIVTPPVVPFIPPPRVLSPGPEASFGRPEPSVASRPSAPLTPPPPPPVIHQGVQCDMCDATIEGIRHKCLDCPDYDLCSPCLSSGASERHNPHHQFLDLSEPTRVVVHTVYEDDETSGHAIHNATCNLCDSRIQGDRYKCTLCPDFDTCGACFSITNEQHPKHSFVKISNPDSYVRRDFSRPVHHLATCDVCNKSIYGVRYKCMHPLCPDFDLCAGCEALPIPQHPDNHPMLKVRTNETVIPTVFRLDQTGALNSPVSPSPYRRRSVHNLSAHVIPGRSSSQSSSVIAAPSLFESCPPSPITDRMMGSSYLSLEAARTDSSSLSRRGSLADLPSLISPLGTMTISNMLDISNHNSPVPEDPPSNPHSISQSLVFAADDPIYPRSTRRLSSPHAPVTDDYNPIDVQHTYEQVVTPPAIGLSTERPESLPSDNVPWADLSRALSNLVQASQADAHPLPDGTPGLVQGRTTMESSPVNTTSPTKPLIFTQPDELSAHSPVPSLDSEALLKRSPISGSLDLVSTGIQVATSTTRSLSALLDAYRSISTTKSAEESRATLGDTDEARLSASFIRSITVPDGQVFAPGVTFIKCWRLLNNGRQVWPENTEVAFVGGTSFSSQALASHVGALKPGEWRDVWTPELKAPEHPGEYTSYWNLRDGEGQLFGQAIWVDIEVVEPGRTPSNDNPLMSSSIIVMPDMSSQSLASAPTTERNTSIVDSDNISDGGMSDSSSVSLVSMPSSEDEEDAALWMDTRKHTTANYVSEAMEYVLLYDDNTSDED